MKNMFSIWAFFGLTLWIDILTHVFIRKKMKRINPYKPLREVSVVVPVHMEPENYIHETIDYIYLESYPLKNVIVIGDSLSKNAKNLIEKIAKDYPGLKYVESPENSKAKKLNYLVKTLGDSLGEFVYIRDCRVMGEPDCIEKMVTYFNSEKVAAVTSYGRVTVPKNFLSRSYFYGKAWINEVGRFRKNAQEKRNAMFVICGASTMFRTKIMQKFPMLSVSQTEDTYYTWLLQKKGYQLRVADDAMVSAHEVDGEGLEGIKGQLKQGYRWSSGTIQCMYSEGRDLLKNKRLAYTTLFPGFIEATMYALPLLLLPILLFIAPRYAIGFLIGDTVFSLLGTIIIIPKKFVKTVYHYPQIFFFKYMNAGIFALSLANMTIQTVNGKSKKWSNEWTPPSTGFVQDM